jgi:hypothetical protein
LQNPRQDDERDHRREAGPNKLKKRGHAAKATELPSTTSPARRPGVVLSDNCQPRQNLADLLQPAPGGAESKKWDRLKRSATRLEALAEPGGIWISGTVHELVRDKLPFTFADKGERVVKNISRPIHVYALAPDVVACLSELPSLPETWIASRRQGPSKTWSVIWAATALVVLLVAAGGWFGWRLFAPRNLPAVGHLSIVVLPFANLSNDPHRQPDDRPLSPSQ